jgi:hypothetical protein
MGKKEKKEFLNEILREDTLEEMENCDGYQCSNCCGAFIDTEVGICHNCKEHTETECYDCVNKEKCPNAKTVE